MTRNAIAALAVLIPALLLAGGAGAAPAGTTIRDLYTVSGIAVDIEAETAAAAREKALRTAQRRALATVLRRIALPEAAPDVAALDASTVAGLVQDLSISGEKTSAVRYIAELEVRLAEGRVRRFLADRQIGYSETPAAPVAILPLFTDQAGRHLWDAGNAWLAAWQKAEIPAGLVPIRKPQPARGTDAGLSAANADRAGRAAYRAYANVHGAGAVILTAAEETPRLSGGPDLDILVRREADDLPSDAQLITVSRQADEARAAHLARGVERVVRAIRTRWKRLTLVDVDARATTVMRIAPAAAAELVAWQRDLQAIAMVGAVAPIALSPGDVKLQVTHLGPRDRLRRVLARHGIGMVPAQGGQWRLERRGTGMAREDRAG